MAEQCAALMGGNGLSTEQSIVRMEEMFLNWNKVILSKKDAVVLRDEIDTILSAGATSLILDLNKKEIQWLKE